MTNAAARNQVFSQMETQRHNAQQATPIAPQTPAERAFELISRMDVAKMTGRKEAFLAAQAELKLLVEEL